MSYESKIDSALTLVREHNEACGGEGKPGFVNPEAFISCLKASGGTNETRLADLSHEDILACIPGELQNGVLIKPRVLAKQIAQVFRNNQQVDTEKRPISTKKVDKMTVRELVESFDPEEFTNSVGKRLAEIAKNEPFIVYDNGRNVNVEMTLKILLEIKSGFKGRDNVDVGEITKRVYRLGELPENYADENPLYRHRPLRPDGTCDQTGRSWEGVPLVVRQFVRLAMDTGELSVNIETAHFILDMVMDADAFRKLVKRYRNTAVQFDELTKTGNLPKLKIELGNGSKKGQTLQDGKKVMWAASPNLANAYKFGLPVTPPRR